MRQIKNLKFFIQGLLAVFFVFYLGASVFAQDKIVAIVNKDVITQKDLDDFINFTRMQLSAEFSPREAEYRLQAMKSDLLNKLVDDQIILQEAKKNNIIVDELRIKGRIEDLKQRYGSSANFNDALRQQGLVQADIESRIREQQLMYNIIEIKVRSKIVVTPHEVTAYYQENPSEFKTPDELQFEAANASDIKIAHNVFNSLKSGQELGNFVSKGLVEVNKMSAKRGQLRKDIEDVVFKLSSGEVSAPVKIDDKYYVFRLINIIPARQEPLADVSDEVYTFLFNKKMQEQLVNWLDALKKKSYIKIFEN